MLIETKLRLPPPGQIELAQSELLALLDGVSQRRLAILSAPTGFGESALLAQWANRVQTQVGAVGWLTADPQDNEIGRFLRYLVEVNTACRPILLRGFAQPHRLHSASAD